MDRRIRLNPAVAIMAAVGALNVHGLPSMLPATRSAPKKKPNARRWPHNNGQRERARRRRQMASGMLRAESRGLG